MNREIVGEPGVSAFSFLQSVRQNLGDHFSWMKASNTYNSSCNPRKQSTMNRELVGEPGVSAFLQSVRQNLGGHISWMEPSNTYNSSCNPRKELKKLKQKLTSFQDLLIDGEARRLGEESVGEWMDNFKHLIYDVEDILDDMKNLSKDEESKQLRVILDRTVVLRDTAKDLELMRDSDPAVSTLLRSICRKLSGDISRMKPNYTTYLYYDPIQDLEKLKEKLLFFQGLVVDGEKKLNDPGVDQWMDGFNDLLYDVEDILDDLNSLSNDQVRVHEFYISSNEKKERLTKILNTTEVLRHRAKDLELKRVSISRYAFPGEANVTLCTRDTASVVDKAAIIYGREDDDTASVVDKAEISYDREDDKAQIQKRLFEVDDKRKKNYDVHCIVGMRGLGKTTLALQVFNGPEVVKHFDVKSWVCISNVFDVARATKDLIINSRGGGGDGGGGAGGGCGSGSLGGLSLGGLSLTGLQKHLRQLVKDKRFLFVLDDVWSSSEWEIMIAPFSSCANGSKILVTTTKIQIAHALSSMDPYQLQKLNDEKCMAIFCDIAFGDDGGEQEKLELVKKIVGACKGIPLVVKVIGSMLRVANVEKWRAVSENMTASWANEYDEIYHPIRLSYYDLSASLKRCFEYLAVFPPDFKFEQDDVVRLWIADGLVEEVEGRGAEDIGAEYYNELKARSLIQGNGMMNNIVHHLATVLSRKFIYQENSKTTPTSARHAFLVNSNRMHYRFLAQARCLRTLIVETHEHEVEQFQVQTRHIQIRSSKILRTLKINSNNNVWKSFLQGGFIKHLTQIRYLSIGRTDVSPLPDSLCMLDNLQFLVLHSISHLKSLPDKMESLSNLRHLVLVFCSSISTLPESICALRQLQLLDLEGCKNLKELPINIGNLRSLWKLCLVETSISSLPESICSLGELQVLSLECCRSLKQLPKDIGNLRSLRKLRLGETSISSLPESICSLGELQVLSLECCRSLKQLPKDIGNLRSLRKLCLGETSIPSLPESICFLGQLQVLSLECCRSLKQLPKDIGNLRNLRTLNLERTSISSLPESVCALTQLQVLNLRECSRLKQLPKDIENLCSLRMVF